MVTFIANNYDLIKGNKPKTVKQVKSPAKCGRSSSILFSIFVYTRKLSLKINTIFNFVSGSIFTTKSNSSIQHLKNYCKNKKVNFICI